MYEIGETGLLRPFLTSSCLFGVCKSVRAKCLFIADLYRLGEPLLGEMSKEETDPGPAAGHARLGVPGRGRRVCQ
jgi:hypothetical protein